MADDGSGLNDFYTYKMSGGNEPNNSGGKPPSGSGCMTMLVVLGVVIVVTLFVMFGI